MKTDTHLDDIHWQGWCEWCHEWVEFEPSADEWHCGVTQIADDEWEQFQCDGPFSRYRLVDGEGRPV